MSRNLKTIFGNFISSGTPIANLLWKEYTINGKDFFDISSNAPGRNFRDKAYQFWYNYLPRLNEYIEDLVDNPNYGEGPEIARLGKKIDELTQNKDHWISWTERLAMKIMIASKSKSITFSCKKDLTTVGKLDKRRW